MVLYGNNSYKATAVILSCIIITCFYYRSPQNVFQPMEVQQLSRYDEYLQQPSAKARNIEYVDKNVMTSDTSEIKPVSDQSTNVKAVDYKLNEIINQKNKNSSDDLELEFNSRQDLLRKGCANLGAAQADQLNIDWDNGKQVRFINLDKMKNARVCVHFKSGYSSWTITARTLRQKLRKGSSKALLITVRNPLVRLLSAWKDKFLGGSPLSKFDEAWRKETSTKENWVKRWERYWMLALVSTGKLEAPESLRNAIKKKQKIRGTAKEVTLPEGSAVKVPGMVDMNDFRNVTFTFEDFLRHVIWTYDNGVPNIHWTPTIVQCDVCHLKYDYILHLENSTQEVPYVLNNLGFGYKTFATVHQSHKTKENKSKVKQKTYIDYYKDVSKNIVDTIIKLYDPDFNLFGYPIPKEFM